MARFVSQVNVGENLNVTYKITGAVTDDDVNKPVKLTATDQVVLCSNGDAIYGFINSVERATADGKVVVGVQIQGRRKCTTDGTVAIGAVIEAAANTAVGTALGQDWGIVSTKTAVAANLATNLAVDNVTTLETESATSLSTNVGTETTDIEAAVNANATAINALTLVLDTATIAINTDTAALDTTNTGVNTSAAAVNAILADAVAGAMAKEWVMISGVGTTGLNILVEKV